MRYLHLIYNSFLGIVQAFWDYVKEFTFGIFPWDTFSVIGALLFLGFVLLGHRYGFMHEYLTHRTASIKSDRSWRSALRSLLPPKNWNPIVLKQDLLLSFTTLLMFGIFIYFLIPVDANGIGRRILFPFAGQIFGFTPGSHLPVSHGYLMDLIFALFLLVMMELGHWIYHYLSHTVPFLWEFHKVHHAQASMTPATDYRLHPIDYAFLLFTQGIFLGIGAVIFYMLFGINAIGQGNPFVAYCFLVIVYLPATLHHSYKWWSWGKLEWVFLSPAWHILHHSKDPKHFNTNFGLRLTIFDHLFGTVSKTTAEPPEGGIEIGIPDEDYNWKDASLWQMLIDPIKKSFKIIWR